VRRRRACGRSTGCGCEWCCATRTADGRHDGHGGDLQLALAGEDGGGADRGCPEAFQSQIKDLLAKYRRTLETDRRFLLEQDEFADLARKVVGSVGTRCWIILMLGRDESDPPTSTPARASGWLRPAPDAGIKRHFPGLAADRGRAGRQAARLLCPPAAGLDLGRPDIWRGNHGSGLDFSALAEAWRIPPRRSSVLASKAQHPRSRSPARSSAPS
jgi:Uncharacterized protein conserved in bacteria (DUF2252)